MDVSVIICCYNSENRIVPTLEHLSKQILGSLRCEIILVDNNCTDETIQIAEEFWNESAAPFSLNVVVEKTPGLSFARKAGVLAAKGEILIFCDDDNWLSEHFVLNGFEIMNSNHDIGVLGGIGIPIFDGKEPNWFSTFQGAYAVGHQSIYSGDITSRGYVWGAGCFVRKDTMLHMYSAGFTSLCTDRKGNELTSGGDSEICKWHVLIGKKLWYDERLVFKHFIENHRLQKEYLSRLIEGFNSSQESLSLYDNLISYNKSNFLQKIKMEIYGILKLLNSYKTEREKRLIKHQIKKVLKNFDSKRIV